jgi:ABC-type nitrate/sulfonate/bicarbonate transport system substrate-binding protein
MKHFLWRLCALILFASFLVSCASPQGAVAEQAPLRVGFASRWGDYTMIVAEQAGFFQQYGVAVQPVFYENSFDALVDMASGQLDGALMSLGDMMSIETHIPIRVVAVSDSGGSGTVVAISTVRNIADLRGRRIGVELGTSNELFVSEMLDRGGLSTDQVNLVNVRPEEMPDAIGSRVDAGFTWEPFATRATARGNRVLYHPGREAGLFPTVIAFRQLVLDARADDIKAFNKAWFAAADSRLRNPETTRQIIAAHFGLLAPDLPADQQVQILNRDQNGDYFRKTIAREGYTLFTAGQINAEFLVQIGVLTRMPDLDTLLDSSYLQ